MNLKSGLDQAVTVLSCDAAEQINYLKSIGLLPNAVLPEFNVDELALNFEDHYLFSNAEQTLLLSVEAKQKLACLWNLLSRLTAQVDESFWTVQGLQHDSRWNEIRRVAAECVSLLNSSSPDNLC